MLRLFLFLSLLVIPSLMVAPVSADNAAAYNEPIPTTGVSAEEFIGQLGNRAVAILADKNLQSDEKDHVFQKMMRESFDLPTIGRFVIGRNAWLGASEQEKQDYLSLFEKLVVKIYSDRFALYSGETFKVVNSRTEGERDTMVNSHILRPGSSEPIIVDWRVRNFDGRLGIIDVIVEGVSMSVTQRQEYSSVIQRNDRGLAALIDLMRDRLERGAPTAKN